VIQEVSEISEDISFVEALSLVVRESGLSQREIIRRSEIGLLEEIEQAKRERDLFKAAILEMMGALRPSTLSRALRGVDSIEYPTLYRIGLGIGLKPGDPIFQRLDGLRQLEERRNHATTQQQRIVLMKGGAKQPNTENDIPSWVNP
jgi:hypothetical protein